MFYLISNSTFVGWYSMYGGVIHGGLGLPFAVSLFSNVPLELACSVVILCGFTFIITYAQRDRTAFRK